MIIGGVLLIIGVLALGLQGVLWVTTHDTVAQAGPFSIQTDRQHAIPLAPIISGVCIAAGIVCLVAGAGKRAT
jgi:hypothetical protein